MADDAPNPAQPRLPSILDEGRTPAEWVQILAERGLDVSERTLREKANRLGACYKIGRVMLITVEQLDTIVRQGRSAR